MKIVFRLFLVFVIAFGLASVPAVAQADDSTEYVSVSVATSWVDPAIDRPVDAPAVSNPVNIRKWTTDMTLGQRVDLVGMLETQALYGNPVRILERQGDWVHVAVVGQPTPRNTLGYPGWVPARQLLTNPVFGELQAARPFALVTSNTTWLSKDAAGRHHEMELSANTRLPVLARTAAAVLVATPDRGSRWLPAKDVRVFAKASDIPRPTGADLVRTAKKFVGLHYLWAGTSAFGFDCSGFTHTVYALNGMTIPRDAGPQKVAGTPVDKADLQVGDLIFYAYNHGTGSVHHVGMYIGDGYEIDAPGNSATQESPLEIVKVDQHRYADEYAGAVRYL
ncbi:C40 family peptidase [Fodinicola acaciae]|uniref:C40 family peptidase n=1 Tax=Fodinicola acaciae TaxID=2681555 RepID=UPI0013D874E7|nr:C40 family peptidase [Fodinicola acaciae]